MNPAILLLGAVALAGGLSWLKRKKAEAELFGPGGHTGPQPGAYDPGAMLPGYGGLGGPGAGAGLPLPTVPADSVRGPTISKRAVRTLRPGTLASLKMPYRLKSAMRKAYQSGDPKKMRWLADQMQARGYTFAAAELRRVAAMIIAGGG